MLLKVSNDSERDMPSELYSKAAFKCVQIKLENAGMSIALKSLNAICFLNCLYQNWSVLAKNARKWSLTLKSVGLMSSNVN